ncbi:hypothetical protein Clacol_009068 [Clathrus columnatus]|uniref:Uncharacterized protein n=1 Tax=Clathrus columnatus TaxID=1419009 RepID=A0AAV5ASD4_9AGAM|nr:hypothetical protein Clacol_009068 [Clathrus columnatus]
MQLFALELSFPILLAAFSLCTSMLAVLGTVQLVVSTPSNTHAHTHGHGDQAALEVGLGMEKRLTPWIDNISPTDTGFVPFESRPPLSMAKLIMLRHAETQRRANARARLRLSQMTI